MPAHQGSDNATAVRRVPRLRVAHQNGRLWVECDRPGATPDLQVNRLVYFVESDAPPPSNLASWVAQLMGEPQEIDLQFGATVPRQAATDLARALVDFRCTLGETFWGVDDGGTLVAWRDQARRQTRLRVVQRGAIREHATTDHEWNRSEALRRVLAELVCEPRHDMRYLVSDHFPDLAYRLRNLAGLVTRELDATHEEPPLLRRPLREVAVWWVRQDVSAFLRAGVSMRELAEAARQAGGELESAMAPTRQSLVNLGDLVGRALAPPNPLAAAAQAVADQIVRARPPARWLGRVTDDDGVPATPVHPAAPLRLATPAGPRAIRFDDKE